MNFIQTVSEGVSVKTGEPAPQDRMLSAAKELEANFLAEMLKHAGFGENRDAFGGGIGEEQFASFLTREQAKTMVEAGGIGLAEVLYNALKEKYDGK